MQKKAKVNQKILVLLMLFLLIKQSILPLIVSAQSHEVTNELSVSESLPLEKENGEKQHQQLMESAEPAREAVDPLPETTELSQESEKEVTTNEDATEISEESGAEVAANEETTELSQESGKEAIANEKISESPETSGEEALSNAETEETIVAPTEEVKYDTDEEVALTEKLSNSDISVTITGPRRAITDSEGEITLQIKELDKNKSEDSHQIASNIERIEPVLPTEMRDAIDASYASDAVNRPEMPLFDVVTDTHLDIALLVNGEVVEPKEPLKVTFEGIRSNQQTNASVKIFHIDEPTQVAEEKQLTVIGNDRVQTEFDRFSPVIIIQNNASGTEQDASDTTIQTFSSNSLGKAANDAMSRMSLLTNSIVDRMPNPGEVITTKTATPVEGMVNTWDITVRAEGRDRTLYDTTDIVLIIDRSGSMSWEGGIRMREAKIAAKDFIRKTLPNNPNLRIAVVSFSSDVTIDHRFSDPQTVTEIERKIDRIAPSGYTHTQAAVVQGHELLKGSAADKKYMVLLSDGIPTVSYKPKTVNRISGVYRAVYDGQYDATSTVGNGFYTGSYYDSATGRTVYINNGQAAIAAGETLKKDTQVKIDGLYTIGVQVNLFESRGDGTDVLKQIATPGNNYTTDNPTQLTEIYREISNDITKQKALREDISVFDEMGDGFSIIGKPTVNDGTTTVIPKTATSNEVIKWQIDGDADQLAVEKYGADTDVRFIEMTYRVEINPDILTAQPATKGADPEHNLFKTNKVTRLTYTDVNNKKVNADFKSPEVDPVLLRIKKVLKDEHGNILRNDPRLFHVAISHGEGKYAHTEPLLSDDAFVWLTTLRHEGSYQVEETGITGVGTNDLSKFQTSYIVDGVEQRTFLVNHDEKKVPRKDVEIVVVNQLIPLTTDFSFTKTDVKGNPLEGAQFTLERIENDRVIETITGTGTSTFIFKNLKAGTYRLTETVAPEGYQLPITSWEITLVKNTALHTLEIQIPDDFLLSFHSDKGYEIKNEKQGAFPVTGASGILPYIVVGMIITASFSGYYNKKEKQWRKKDDKEI